MTHRDFIDYGYKLEAIITAQEDVKPIAWLASGIEILVSKLEGSKNLNTLSLHSHMTNTSTGFFLVRGSSLATLKPAAPNLRWSISSPDLNRSRKHFYSPNFS
jgi:hypothetical protein